MNASTAVIPTCPSTAPAQAGAEQLRIHSIETMGASDGPGLRLVVFTQGCLMRCAYCHNPDTLDLRGGNVVAVSELVERALLQKRYFGARGGVTVSGGEPTLQRGAVAELFGRLHAHGIHTCLDTNGLILDEGTKALYDRTDLVLLDVKHINDEWHRRLTGVSNETPLAVAAYRESTGRPMWLRYVLVPGWTDQEQYLEEWARRFSGYRTVERVEVLPYHQLGVHKWAKLGMDYRLKDVSTPTAEIRERARGIFEKYFATVIVK